MEQTRREFIRTCAAASAVSALALAGMGCSGEDDGGGDGGGNAGPECAFTINENGNVVVNLDECTELQNDNKAVRLEGTPFGRRVLLTHSSGDTYFALDSRCTHQGCTVAATIPTLNCPCHGSRYNLSGTVNQGPAPSALQELPIAKLGNLLVITV